MRSRAGLIGGLVALLALAAFASAKPGKPDRTFSGDGRGQLMPEASVFSDTVVDRHGRVVAVGRIGHISTDFLVARYTPRGRLDRTFGGDGFVETNVDLEDSARGVALDRQGRIVVAGIAGGMPSQVAVLRYRPSGALDTSFATDGEDGVFTLNITPDAQSDGANDVALDSQGRIVAAGVRRLNSDESEFAVVRLLASGVPDNDFAGDGVATTNVAGSVSEDQANAVAIDRAGRIVAAGVTVPSAAMAAARFLPGGAADESFGPNGVAIVPPDDSIESEAANGVVIARGNRVILGGRTGDLGPLKFTAARLRTDGALDSTFGDGGEREVEVEVGADGALAHELVQDPDGRLFLAGYRFGGAPDSFAAVRLTASGAIDNRFGRQGRAILPFPGGDAQAEGAALDPRSGRLLLAGHAEAGASEAFGAVARLETQPRCFRKAPTIVGTNGRDRLRGTRKADVIYGGRGRDVIKGRRGRDRLCGGPGRDRIVGGPGRDRVNGGPGRDRERP